ncbi:MAG TPA: hypothetical protein VJL89_09520, partial [Thermodesulfovibrionia bacterium]|nr:hypothetical protein [Thermodesulfovibrionia bacterium]
SKIVFLKSIVNQAKGFQAGIYQMQIKKLILKVNEKRLSNLLLPMVGKLNIPLEFSRANRCNLEFF